MKRFKIGCVTLFLFLWPLQLGAVDFDGSGPLLCAVIDVVECGVENGCQEGTAESIDIPQFIKIDFEKNMASGSVAGGEVREVQIERKEHDSGMLVMQGGQEGRGWSMVIGEETGKMSLTVSGDRFGFVIFGACTPL
jgi:hypothetical protein